MARLISRAEFSRIAGVSDAAISKWCRGPGADASDGKRIDADHPAARKYLADKGVAPTPTPKKPAKAPPKPTAPRPESTKAPPKKPPRANLPTAPEPDSSIPLDGLTLDSLTIEQAKLHFGSVTAFRDWLDAQKKLVDIRAAELKIGEHEGALIERELVAIHVFGVLESSHKRLLADAPKSIAQKLYAMARAGEPVESAEAYVRDVIGKILEPVVTNTARNLRDG